MKILYINTLYAPHIGGGAEITLQTLVEGMQRAGHEVAVLTIGPEPGLRRDEVNGVTVWRAGYRNMYFHHRSEQVSTWRRMLWHLRDRYNRPMRKYVREVVRTFRPDVASCHNLAGWSISVWDELTTAGVPIVQVLHDQYLLCPRSTMFRNDDRCAKQCPSCKALRVGHSSRTKQVAAVIGVSKFIKDKMISNGYFAGVKIAAHIHNARKLGSPALSGQPRNDDGNVTFGFIGTLAPTKGIGLLLDAFVRSAPANWRLRIAGRGLREYEIKLRKTFIDERISFLGHVAPREFFPDIDVTVVPSVWDEPLGMVVAESLMYGRPVLASNRGGITEMVGEDNGIVFSPTSQSMAGAMADFASAHEAWRLRIGAIQASGAAYADEPAWLSRYEQVFKSACSERKAGQ